MASIPQSHCISSLYQPSASEIGKVAASALRRHPKLAARIGKASDTLLSGGLQLDPLAWELRNVARWRVTSQSHNGAYIVVGLNCPCQDSYAPIVGGIRLCKHAIAVSLYMKILRNRVNADIRNREIDLGILVDGTFNAYAPRMGMVQMKRSGTTYTFADTASAVRYSQWLASRHIIALPVRVGHSARVSLAA